MRRVLFGIGLYFFCINGYGQSDSAFIAKIASEVFRHSTAYSNLHELTKSIGPRLSGSPQTYAAEQWGIKTLRAAGADTVYLQSCMIPHWVRGKKEQVTLIQGQKKIPLQAIALGNSVGTSKEGIKAPVILIHNFDELEQRKDEIRGKIVFYNYPMNPDFVNTLFAYFDAVPYRGYGASRAAKYGAVGMVVRSMSESVDNNPHTGAMRYNDSFPKIPALALGLRDADKLAAAIEKNPSTSLYLFSGAYRLPDTTGYNVIAEWRGTEFPDQYITVGGHLDSWDPAEGAQDDGAGCVHSIEVLRALKAAGYKPRHTIRVVLFTDEENGGSGGNQYAAVAAANNEKHIFALESDGGGFTPRAFTVSANPAQLATLRSWAPLLSPYGISEILNMGGGADVDPLYATRQIPVGELIPDTQRYFDYHHSAGDVFEVVNKRELELGAITMAALIFLTDKYGL
ncbi:MAG TPA: M20/M25/M40 family metallo-hydrolase [Puia sp.]|nr:M20/M25/M40 family metallo-hydrolase [Puia sp.]